MHISEEEEVLKTPGMEADAPVVEPENEEGDAGSDKGSRS